MNKNYRIMKFFKPIDKLSKAKGYIRFETRGTRGTFNITVENISKQDDISEVFILKNNKDKIRLGSINSRKGTITKNISLIDLTNQNTSIEDYDICVVYKKDEPVLYTTVFSNKNVDYNLLNIREPNRTTVKRINAAKEETKKATLDRTNAEEETRKIEINRTNLAEKETHNTTINKANTVKEETIKTDKIEKEAKIASAIAEKIIKFKDKTEISNSRKDNLSNIKKETEKVDFENKIKDDKKVEKEKEIKVKRIIEKKEEKPRIKQEKEYNTIYNILDKFERIEPLKDNIEGLKWWKINYDDKSIYRGFLPFFNQIISVYYPYPLTNRVTTCQNLMKKHGFYIFGIYEENNKISKYVYGIPGKFLREEQPYRGITGFKNWSYKNNEVMGGDYGFWLAFINAVNGEISDPPKVDK